MLICYLEHFITGYAGYQSRVTVVLEIEFCGCLLLDPSDDVHQIANTICGSLGDVDMILCGIYYSHMSKTKGSSPKYYAVCMVCPAGCMLSRRDLLEG